MITSESLQSMLATLDFKVNKNVYSKHFSDIDATLKVDLNKQKIVYPEKLTINESQTCNFSSNENFVVFECVCC